MLRFKALLWLKKRGEFMSARKKSLIQEASSDYLCLSEQEYYSLDLSKAFRLFSYLK